MGPGFKYHVVTVSSIFFALAVGLLVGSLFVSPGVADRQSHAISALKSGLDAQARQLEPFQRFAHAVSPSLLKGRLAGTPVAVIQTGDYPDATAHAVEALRAADATITSVTVIDKLFNRPDAVLSVALSSVHPGNGTPPGDRAALAAAIVTALTGGDAAIMAALAEKGILHADGPDDYGTAARYIVIVAGSRTEDEGTDRVANVDQVIIAAIQKAGIGVIACEPSDAAASDVKAYRAAGIEVATVDDIDNEIGACALVLAAATGGKDDYGIKETAQELLPTEALRPTP